MPEQSLAPTYRSVRQTGLSAATGAPPKVRVLDDFKSKAEAVIAMLIAKHQEELKRTGVICDQCGKPGASAQDEADHNTGDCHCTHSRTLCWREWWLDRCQPDG